jgi:hypothetical protein
MNIEWSGDRITVDEFWDCACDNDYIHRDAEDCCDICKECKEDMPNSQLPEILIEYEELTWEERHELIYFMYNELTL